MTFVIGTCAEATDDAPAASAIAAMKWFLDKEVSPENMSVKLTHLCRRASPDRGRKVFPAFQPLTVG
jgi:hypothetical protein